MKNKLILGFLIIAGVGFFSYISQPREVYCEYVQDYKEAKTIILTKSKLGWKLTQITSSNGTYQNPVILIVMEK